MQNLQSSRRRFLSSMAILSACFPFASATNLIPDGYSTADLRRMWKFFCSVNTGEPFNELLKSKYVQVINPCSGHLYKTGELIYFSKENIVAQPTWVFWGKEKSKPADVIITFFNNDFQGKKILCINRFELESMCAFFEGNNERSLMPLLHEATQNKHTPGHGNKLQIRTLVKDGGRVQIVASLSMKDISIDKNLLYNFKQS